MGNGFKERLRVFGFIFAVTAVPLLIALAMQSNITTPKIILVSGKPSPAPMLVGRFQLVAPGSNAAYDTVTGRMCWLYDPIGQGSEKIPLCKDIYDGR